MSLSELPQPIKDYIMKRINDEDYEPMPNTYSLTELLGCIRQTHLKKIYMSTHEGKSKPFNLESCYSFYRGKLFDAEWTRLFKRSQIRCTFRTPKMPVTVSGHFDFVYDNAVWDLKTTKNLYFVKEASSQYINQVRFYAFCNSLKYGKLLYIDMGGCKVFDVPIGDCTELMQDIENRAITLYNSLINLYCTTCHKQLPPDFDSKNGEVCPNCNIATMGELKAPQKPIFAKNEAWHCDKKYCQFESECRADEDKFQMKLNLF